MARILVALLVVAALLGAIWYAVASEPPRSSHAPMEVERAPTARARGDGSLPPDVAPVVAPVDASGEQRALAPTFARS